MTRFWRGFIPYQLWRFVVINTKMYLIARGILGPHAGAIPPTRGSPTSSSPPLVTSGTQSSPASSPPSR